METKELQGRRVVVMGLGRFGGGIAAVRWLVDRGADVTVTDQASAGKLADSVAQLADLPVTFHLGGHDEADLDGCNLLVVSPAVPRDKSDFVRAAVKRGIPITSEMNLFVERCRARCVVGVTGSAGKSTTTAMVGAVLTEAARAGELPAAWMGGNIGQSLLAELDAIEPDDVVVLELSSFQLEHLADLRWSPQLAVITNLSPNHLDRHGTMAAYADAKMNIFRYQPPDGKVFIHRNEEGLASLVERAGAGPRMERYEFDPTYADVLQVPGAHNRANAAVAIAVARALGIEEDTIRRGLSGFGGLPHRLELAGEHDGVRFFNDSKSTTPESTVIALDAFEEPVVMLVGGSDKGMSFESMAKELASRAKGVVCYGDTGGTLFEQVARYVRKDSGKAKVALADGFADALKRGRTMACSGDVVVLSPACASYDMFANYEERGEAFRELVRKLGV